MDPFSSGNPGSTSDSAFPRDPVILARWTYVYDNVPEEYGGGFHSGEFSLLVDGRLFRRAAHSTTSATETLWQSSGWQYEQSWKPCTATIALFEFLTGRGYELYPPTPIPADATTAGPFPEVPKLAGPALRKVDATGVSPELFKRALDFAARVHQGQSVPGSGLPYVVHVVKVAMEVQVATEGDAELDRNLAVACALMHDTVEDCEGPREEMVARLSSVFGPFITAGVVALSKEPSIPKSDRMTQSLRSIRTQPREIWIVKLADRITNLEPPPPGWSTEKRRSYRDEARQILEALGDASASLRRRFEQKLVEYERYCGWSSD